MSYKLTIGNHPSQARHPVSNEPLWGQDGEPVPLFPDHGSIRLDGRVIAYISAENNISFLSPFENMPEVLKREALELVEKERGPLGKVSAPPKAPQPAEESTIYTGED